MQQRDDFVALEVALRLLAERVAADETFTRELYGSLCNVRWQRKGTTPPVSTTWRSAAAIVAELVGEGRCYLDYYCSGNEGEVSERVRTALAGLGWSPVPWPD